MKTWQKTVGVNIRTIMNKIILSGILLFISLSSCTVDNGRGQTVSFMDLPKEVQDTILYWTENDVVTTFTASDDTTLLSMYDKPELLCFDEKYTLERTEFGPWILHKILTRISDGKEYKLTRNAPVPIIVHNDTLIIPDEYNILTVWDPSVKWRIYKLP